MNIKKWSQRSYVTKKNIHITTVFIKNFLSNLRKVAF
jgi:hypothetical protein